MNTAARPADQIEGDRLADKLCGEQACGDRVHRHGVGDAGRRGALQRHHPENEGERATRDPEIDCGDPLRRAEARQHREPAGRDARDDQRGSAAAHADAEKAERAGARDERTREHVVERHAQHGPRHDQLAAPGPGRRIAEIGGERARDAKDRDADAERFARGERFDPQHRARQHGPERQGRERKARARRRREADRDVVEDEEHAEENDAEQRDRREIAPARPARAQHQRNRQHDDEADAPAQGRKRQRVGIGHEIAGHRRGGAAERARDDGDDDAERFAHGMPA